MGKPTMPTANTQKGKMNTANLVAIQKYLEHLRAAETKKAEEKKNADKMMNAYQKVWNIEGRKRRFTS